MLQDFKINSSNWNSSIVVAFANLPSPVLTSSGNVSVLLRWSANPVPVLEPGFTLTFLLQKLTLGLSEDWQFHNSVKWLSAQRVRVSDLRPYVTYKVS